MDLKKGKRLDSVVRDEARPDLWEFSGRRPIFTAELTGESYQDYGLRSPVSQSIGKIKNFPTIVVYEIGDPALIREEDAKPVACGKFSGAMENTAPRM